MGPGGPHLNEIRPGGATGHPRIAGRPCERRRVITLAALAAGRSSVLSRAFSSPAASLASLADALWHSA